MRITKTDYMEYTLCPKNLWLKKHKPKLFENIPITDFQKEIILNGQIVDEASMALFPAGKLVTSKNLDPLNYSKELIAKKSITIFQASFEWDDFFARTDILYFDEDTDSWSLYEVKSTNSVKKTPYNHIKDLAFQKLVLKSNNVHIGHVGVIHLNKEYQRNGLLDYDQLFEETDVTNDVQDIEDIVRTEMNDMKKYLGAPEKSGCDCLYKGRSAQCQTFSYSNPYVPEYSVHNISRIGTRKKILTDWINRGIYAIENIDNPEVLNGYPSFQYLAHIKGKAVVDSNEILRTFNDLEFPIHFLDYETYTTAIPKFDRCWPWQQMPFQYSVHVLNNDGSLEHKEYILKEPSKDMTLALVENLAEDMNGHGTVVVWYAPFETTRNNELATLHPEYSGFLSNMNDHIFDLMKMFSDGHYVDPAFKGSNSIKDVLPVLIPDLAYTDLEIQSGTEAPIIWNQFIDQQLEPSEQKAIENNLLEYCKRDTLAMVKIYQFLKALSK
tara:strand:+ start:353 stop:1840 length:1488 start_codon:yes stop_codon:yes gene_type:complete